MAIKILVMGLPGAGKTYFAKQLKQYLEQSGTVEWFNADLVREKFSDWDFSNAGRLRQAERMKTLAINSDSKWSICDFIAPSQSIRDLFDADWTIWIDTIDSGRFEDTNKIFEEPLRYDFRITEQDSEKWAPWVGGWIKSNTRRPVFDYRAESVQMLGRWQPWHSGHRALFDRAILKTGQVVVMVRDCKGWNNSNPFAVEEIKSRIRRDLDPLYQGQYEIMVVPNIVNITYGRDVGYKIEQEVFDDSIHAISATKIRKDMGIG